TRFSRDWSSDVCSSDLTLIESQGKGQQVEIQVKELKVLGAADPDTYPIQPKKHSLEFLREKAHLRVRTNTFAAIMRVRSALSFRSEERRVGQECRWRRL